MFIFKYKFPIHIILIFEKIEISIFLSQKINYNHYLLIISQNWYFVFNKFLKNEFFCTNNFIVEMSIIDMLLYFTKNQLFLKNFEKIRFLLFINYYFYKLKCKFTIFIPLNLKKKILSIETIYANTSWLEREVSELFGIFFLNKIDNRNLLLDYSQFDYPMRKDFNCEGYTDIFYNFFENTTSILKNEIVEL